MEFRVKINYDKEYFSKSESTLFKYIFLLLRVAAFFPLLNFIYEARYGGLWFTGASNNIQIMLPLTLFVIVITVFCIWITFSLPRFEATLVLAIAKRKKRDGEQLLIFNEQGLTVSSLKYSTARLYPIEKFKSIKTLGDAYRVHIGIKQLLIKRADFESGEPEDFYRWMTDICKK